MSGGPPDSVSRRALLKVGGGTVGVAGAASIAAAVDWQGPAQALQTYDATPTRAHDMGSMGTMPAHADMMTMPTVMGEVDHIANGFNPTDLLTDFDAGTISTLPGGQILHEYWITAFNKDVEVVPGIVFNAWTYNGRVPGPTIRVPEGDRIRIHF